MSKDDFQTTTKPNAEPHSDSENDEAQSDSSGSLVLVDHESALDDAIANPVKDETGHLRVENVHSSVPMPEGDPRSDGDSDDYMTQSQPDREGLASRQVDVLRQALSVAEAELEAQKRTAQTREGEYVVQLNTVRKEHEAAIMELQRAHRSDVNLLVAKDAKAQEALVTQMQDLQLGRKGDEASAATTTRAEIEATKQKYQHEVEVLRERYKSQVARLTTEHDNRVRRDKKQHETQLRSVERNNEAKLQSLKEKHAGELVRQAEEHHQDVARIRAAHQDTVKKLEAQLREVRQQNDRLKHDLQDASMQRPTPGQYVPASPHPPPVLSPAQDPTRPRVQGTTQDYTFSLHLNFHGGRGYFDQGCPYCHERAASYRG